MTQTFVETLEDRRLLSAVVGTQSLVFAVIRFSDQKSYPESMAAAKTQTSTALKNITSYSGGQLKFKTAIIKDVTLKHTLAYYQKAGSDAIATDTKAALTAAGVKVSSFDHISYRYSGITGANPGIASVGGTQSWIRDNSSIVLTHELGHNLGLEHSHFANPTTSDPFGPATVSEYGDPFSNMGSGGSEDYAAPQKYDLGWLSGGQVKTIDASKTGTFTVDLSTNDNVSSYSSSFVYLIRINLGSNDAIYVSYDSGKGGVFLYAASYSDPSATTLLDMTPSTSTASDAALKFGKSVTDKDSSNDIKFSVAKSGSKAAVTIKIS